MTHHSAPLIAAHIYLVLGESISEARRFARFLLDRTGEPISKVEEWAIIGDLMTAESRVREYLDAGVGYFVFYLPYTQDYLDAITRYSRFINAL